MWLLVFVCFRPAVSIDFTSVWFSFGLYINLLNINKNNNVAVLRLPLFI